MACHCFDFCTGEDSCLDMSSDQSEQACINACNASGRAFFYNLSNWGGPSGPFYPSCGWDSGWHSDLIVQNGTTQWTWGGRSFEGTLWQLSGDAVLGCIACFPDSPLHGGPGNFTNVECLNLGLFYMAPTWNDPPRGSWTPLGTPCVNRVVSCCGAGVPRTPYFDLPARAYRIGGGCYEAHRGASLGCEARPCCRQGVIDWPPYPPFMGSACDLSTPEDCTRRGFRTTSHRNAFSCWFPHACSGVAACGDPDLSCAKEQFPVAYLPTPQGGDSADIYAEFVSQNKVGVVQSCRLEGTYIGYKVQDGTEDATGVMCDVDYIGGPMLSYGAFEVDVNGDSIMEFGYLDHV